MVKIWMKVPGNGQWKKLSKKNDFFFFSKMNTSTPHLMTKFCSTTGCQTRISWLLVAGILCV